MKPELYIDHIRTTPATEQGLIERGSIVRNKTNGRIGFVYSIYTDNLTIILIDGQQMLSMSWEKEITELIKGTIKFKQ